VKGNQDYLLYDCERAAKKQPDDICKQYSKKERNRKETRIVRTFKDIVFLDKYKWAELIRMMIQVERKIQRFDTKTKNWNQSLEISYYVATKKFSAKEAAKIIRNHWGIENKNHYVKDVSMREDFSRIRKNPHIMANLRSTALNIMRANGVQNVSVELYSNSLNIHGTIRKYQHLLR
jgi:predicted transposase YbfD/YdcC